MTPRNGNGVAMAPCYHVIKPKPREIPVKLVLKRHKDAACTRQLAIYADERRHRSGEKRLRCIVNCYAGRPSILLAFDERGRKVQSYRLKRDYADRLPRKDARTLARVRPGVDVIVERF